MKRTASPPNSPGSSYARLTTSANAVRNQAPDTQVSNQPIPTLSAYETPPLPDWNDVSDSIDDADLIDHSDLRLNQRSREQLKQEHWHAFSKQSQSEKKLKFRNEDLEEFSPEKREDLITWIKVTDELVGLDIDASWLNKDEAHGLLKAITFNTSLKTLFLQDHEHNIGSEKIKVLMESFKTNTSLKKLNLDMCKIDSDGLKALGEALKVNTCLNALDFWISHITLEGITALTEAIKVNTSLKKLRFWTHCFDSDGLKALGEALKINTALEKLEIDEEEMDSGDIVVLAEGLKVNTSLKKLALFTRDIDADGLKALGEALKVNTALNKLGLHAHKFYLDGFKALAEALKLNTSLKQLVLDIEDMTLEGIEALAEALKVNTSLNALNYIAQKIDADGLNILMDGLKINTTLTDLKIPKIQIDDSDPYSLVSDLSNDSASESEEEYPAQLNYEDQLRGPIHRNKLWPLTHPAGVGLSTTINHQHPDLINTFPEEVGNLITQYMLWMSTTNDNPMTKFQGVERNLFELAYGTKATGVSPAPTS